MAKPLVSHNCEIFLLFDTLDWIGFRQSTVQKRTERICVTFKGGDFGCNECQRHAFVDKTGKLLSVGWFYVHFQVFRSI